MYPPTTEVAMPPYDYDEDWTLRDRAERIVLERYSAEVEAEKEKLKMRGKQLETARQLHELGPNKHIAIIKVLRQVYGLGLKEAKELMEEAKPLPF
jgi:ribosomal protein L7/L12